MIPFLLAIITLSLVLLIIFSWLSRPQQSYDSQRLQLITVIFALWLIASALWGRPFFVLIIPGFFDITVERFLFLFIVWAMFIGLFTGRIDLSKRFTIEILMFGYVVTCMISMMQHGFLSATPELFPNPWFVFISGYLFPFVVFVFAKHFLTQEKDQTLVFHALFLFGTYLAIMAYFEFLQLRQFVFPSFINDPDFSLHLERARGPFLNAGLNGLAITIGFVCGVHLLSVSKGYTKWIYRFLLLLFFPAIFFTQSRSVYLGFFITATGLLIFYRTDFPKIKLWPLPLTLILIFLAFQSPRLLSSDRKTGGVLQIAEVVVRIELIRRSIEMFRDRPLLGVGFGQFLPGSLSEYRGRGTVAEKAEEETQHNHILGLLVEIGLVGVLFYLLIVIYIFRRITRMWGKIPDTGFMGTNFLLIGAIVWIIYLSNNMFLEPGYFLFINAVPFMFAGIIDGLYNREVFA